MSQYLSWLLLRDAHAGFYKVKWPTFGHRYHVNQAILEKKVKELVVPGGSLKWSKSKTKIYSTFKFSSHFVSKRYNCMRFEVEHIWCTYLAGPRRMSSVSLLEIPVLMNKLSSPWSAPSLSGSITGNIGKEGRRWL